MIQARALSLVGLLASIALALVTPVDVRPAHSTYQATHPTNAAKIFRWGNAAWNDEFVRPLSATTWQVNPSGQVRNQHGMLTLNATPRSRDVTASVIGHDQQYGRWEARVRTRGYRAGNGASGTPYRAVWELVPSRGGYGCGARSIVLSDYPIGGAAAAMHVRNTPDADFTASKALPLRNTFHTYAVEVTPDHVSWFVDTEVVMTERRPAALSGATFTARFRLVSTPGATMRTGRMQMDWVRYYSLARPNAHSITAPQAARTTYDDAC